MAKIDWLSDISKAVDEVMKEIDPSMEEQTFTMSRLYQAAMGPRSKENIPLVFGSSCYRRFLQFGGNLRKPKMLDSLKLRLPADAIIFFRTTKKGIIATSREKDMVLKIFLDEGHIPLLQDEIHSLEHLQQTDFSPYAAKLKASGKNWIITNFSSNSKSLLNLKDTEKYLLENFSTLLLPPMALFYKAHELQIIKLSDWMLLAQERLAHHPGRLKLARIVKMIEAEMIKYPEHQLIQGGIHHDLHAGNILLSEERLTVIDWEGGTRGLVLIDIMDFSRRFLNTHKREDKKFWKFMQGKRELPSLLANAFVQYANWAKHSFSLEVPLASFRLHVYLYVLERSLLLYEKRQVDRTLDKQGFEFKVMTC